jgi:hypothetical protein
LLGLVIVSPTAWWLAGVIYDLTHPVDRPAREHWWQMGRRR